MFYPARRSLKPNDRILLKEKEYIVKNMLTVTDEKKIEKSVPYNVYYVELDNEIVAGIDIEINVWKIKDSNTKKN